MEEPPHRAAARIELRGPVIVENHNNEGNRITCYGTVVRFNPDGTVRVLIDAGEIDINPQNIQPIRFRR